MEILKEEKLTEKKEVEERERTLTIGKKARNLFTYIYPHSYVSEQFRIIRFALLRQVRDKNMRSVLVTSTMPGEGKTLIAANLAVSIAPELEKETVLIDFDLRKPSIHEILGIGKQEVGLSDFFSRGIPLPEIVMKTNIPNFSVVTSGSSRDPDAVSVTARKMRELKDAIQKYNQEYFFILDSGPACLIADPLVISDVADGIVLVVKSGYTKRSVLENTIKLIGNEKIVGVVLNYSRSNPDLYRNYHRYYSY